MRGAHSLFPSPNIIAVVTSRAQLWVLVLITHLVLCNGFEIPDIAPPRAALATHPWSAAPLLLERRDTSFVAVKCASATSPSDPAWLTASSGSAFVALDFSGPESSSSNHAAVVKAVSSLWPSHSSPPPDNLAEFIADVSCNFHGSLPLRLRSPAKVRAKLSILDGQAAAPCPKLHADKVALRCIVALLGPSTSVALEGGDGGRPVVASPPPLVPLLLKGTLWGPFSPAAYHSSPKPEGGRRAVLVIDRLEDV